MKLEKLRGKWGHLYTFCRCLFTRIHFRECPDISRLAARYPITPTCSYGRSAKSPMWVACIAKKYLPRTTPFIDSNAAILKHSSQKIGSRDSKKIGAEIEGPKRSTKIAASLTLVKRFLYFFYHPTSSLNSKAKLMSRFLRWRRD